MFSATTSKKELLEYVATFDVVAYKNTRNHLSGTVSCLSPFITRGVVTLPEIRQVILEHNKASDAEKFIQELAWREYWQQVWFAKGKDIFTDLRFPRSDWAHSDMVGAIVNAATKIKVVDDAIKNLEATGYMHNHARMWVAMLACNVGKAHWFNMSRWLYYHLYDGDLASNMLSWQWVAGTNASKRYMANQEVINGCSDYKEVRTYLTMPREEVGEGAIPPVLVPSTPFSYAMEYPQSESYDHNASTLFLYSPWTLNPDWRKGEEGVRVLLIEPSLFNEFPVSPSVMEFICTVAKTQIPGIKVVISNVQDLSLQSHTHIFSVAYPAHQDWPGEIDSSSQMFPHTHGYYPSFFKFWEACQRSI